MKSPKKHKAIKLIIKERERNPYIGVRGIAKLLKEKYQVDISKSLVSDLLKAKGVKGKKGRKPVISLYKREEVDECGLLLLKIIDQEMGLIDSITDALAKDCPQINKKILRNIVLYLSFSAFLGLDPLKNSLNKGLLKLTGLYNLPSSGIAFILDKIKQTKPSIDLSQARRNLQPVSSIKFYFESGYIGFCDANLTTFWSGPCHMREFFNTFGQVKKKVEKIIENKIVAINYTKSFDYLSPLVVKFIDGLSGGLKSIEILGEKEEVLEKIKLLTFRPAFAIGYYPKILSKGMIFMEKTRKFRKFYHAGEDIFYLPISTKFMQPKDHKAAVLSNLLLARKKKNLPTWGLIVNRKGNETQFAANYLHWWPYREEVFLEEIKLFEKFFTNAVEKKDLVKILPQELVLDDELAFGKIMELLRLIFIEKIGNFEFKNRKGKLIVGKDFLKIAITAIPVPFKKIFNRAALHIDKRRVFLV